MAMIPRQSLWRSERGAELIEFAMVMPILILLLAGIFDFGMMFRSLEAVTNAAREGARVGVLPGYEDPANVRARVDAYLVGSGLTGSYPLPEVETVPVATPAGTFTAVVGQGHTTRINFASSGRSEPPSAARSAPCRCGLRR